MKIFNLLVAFKGLYNSVYSGLKLQCGTDNTVGSSLGVRAVLVHCQIFPSVNKHRSALQHRRECRQK